MSTTEEAKEIDDTKTCHTAGVPASSVRVQRKRIIRNL